MSACERCWADAQGAGDAPHEYALLLVLRMANPCTPEQQAGPDARPCADCGGRRVRHQITGECMANRSHGRVSSTGEGAGE